eukprot:scaffold397_cov403-Prasinococcus_capsulatus_cf.AAC.9
MREEQRVARTTTSHNLSGRTVAIRGRNQRRRPRPGGTTSLATAIGLVARSSSSGRGGLAAPPPCS